MTIYDLDDFMPETPDPGRYWVAPDADVIGDSCDVCALCLGELYRKDSTPPKLLVMRRR